jgi:hypothetical protein
MSLVDLAGSLPDGCFSLSTATMLLPPGLGYWWRSATIAFAPPAPPCSGSMTRSRRAHDIDVAVHAKALPLSPLTRFWSFSLHALGKFLRARFAIPLLKRLIGNLTFDKELCEFAALRLAFKRHD